MTNVSGNKTSNVVIINDRTNSVSKTMNNNIICSLQDYIKSDTNHLSKNDINHMVRRQLVKSHLF